MATKHEAQKIINRLGDLGFRTAIVGKQGTAMLVEVLDHNLDFAIAENPDGTYVSKVGHNNKFVDVPLKEIPQKIFNIARQV